MLFDQPWALAGLLGALLVLWLGRRLGRPSTQYTGAFALWRTEDRTTAEGAHKNRIPPARWALAAALALASVSMARPHATDGVPRPTLRLCIDGSPSMHLPMPDGRSRLEAALERAQRELGDLAGGLEHQIDPTLGEMPDEPGVLWITDRCPDPMPVHAGVSASGGSAVPGPIAAGSGERILWTGRHEGVTTLSEDWVEDRSLQLASDLPACVVALARLWAQERGLTLEDRGGPRLVVRRAPADGAPFGTQVRGEGWNLKATVVGHATGRSCSSALGPDGERTLVGVAPGVLEVAFDAPGNPDGDPAAFALTWAGWLDEALPLPMGVVPLGERRSAGESCWHAPRDARAVQTSRGARFEPWLAAAAALAAALALALSMNGRPL
tara:strand:- start:1204 stop:2352 length:1149 start_codon:yes stop_codon:yes gene_type:complete